MQIQLEYPTKHLQPSQVTCSAIRTKFKDSVNEISSVEWAEPCRSCPILYLTEKTDTLYEYLCPLLELQVIA